MQSQCVIWFHFAIRKKEFYRNTRSGDVILCAYDPSEWAANRIQVKLRARYVHVCVWMCDEENEYECERECRCDGVCICMFDARAKKEEFVSNIIIIISTQQSAIQLQGLLATV